jgi:hypothetical protein
MKSVLLFGLFVLLIGAVIRLPGSLLRDLGSFLKVPGNALCKFGAKMVKNNFPDEVKEAHPDLIEAFTEWEQLPYFLKRTTK